MSEKIDYEPRPYNVPGYKPADFGLDPKYVNKAIEQLFYFGGNNDGSFLYKRQTKNNSGGQLFERVANSPIYKHNVTNIEAQIFEEEILSLKKFFVKSKNNIIELGPGGGDKFFELITDKYGIKNKGYIGVDISAYSLEKAKEYADKRHIKSIMLLNDRSEEKIYNDHEGAIVYLGGSIGNLSEGAITSLLREFAIGSQRNVIISHFIAPDGEDKEARIQEIIENYKTPEVEEFIMSGFGALGLDTSKMELAVEYKVGENEKWIGRERIIESDKVRVGVRMKEDLVIEIPRRGKVIKEKGDTIWAISSRRFTKDKFEKIAEGAGCKLVDSYAQEGMAITVLSTPAAQRMKVFIKKYQSTISTILLATAVAGGVGYTVSENKIKDKQEKISKAWQTDLYGREIDSERTTTELINALSKDLNETVHKAEEVLHMRYGRGDVDGYEGRVLIGLLRKYFIDMDQREYEFLRGYQQGLSRQVDKFVQEYKAPILEGGYNIVPNAFMRKYQEHIKNTLVSTDEVNVNNTPTHSGREITKTKTITGQNEYTAEGFSKISGILYGVQFSYDVATVKLNGKKYIVAKLDGVDEEINTSPYNFGTYSLELGRQAVKEYLDGGYLHEVAERAVLALYEKLDIQNLQPETWTYRIEQILLQARVEGYDFSLFLNKNIPIEYILNTFVFQACGEVLNNVGSDSLDYFAYRVALHANELVVKELCDDKYNLLPLMDSILHVLNEDYDRYYSEVVGDGKFVDEDQYPKVKNTIFNLLAAGGGINIPEMLNNKIGLWKRVEGNAELFNEFNYRVFPFELFHTKRESFANSLSGSFEESIRKGAIMPHSIGLYTTLKGERFNIALSVDETFILAQPINKMGIKVIERLKQEYKEKFALFRFQKPFTQLEELEKEAVEGSTELQFNRYSAFAGKYVAEDFFKQEQERNIQSKTVSENSDERHFKQFQEGKSIPHSVSGNEKRASKSEIN